MSTAGQKEAIYELRYFATWPGQWRGCEIGKLGGLIRKYRPVMVNRIW